MAGLHAANRAPSWGPARLLGTFAVLLGLKEIQEWALHDARLFDQITFVEALQQIWQAITGG